MAIDHVLKLYAETIRSPYLHYGFWENPEAVNPEELSLADITTAQERYIEHLASFIPEDVRTILDVGCGIGGNARYLMNQGYEVEALSPDGYQETAIKKEFNGTLPFYRTKFEKFTPSKSYDLILESESPCYIKINEGFKQARESLRDGGYLLAADYFIHFRDDSRSPHLRSSHRLDRYINGAENAGFEILKEYDQTDNTMPTLMAAQVFVERFIQPTVEYALHSFYRKRLKLLALVKRLYGRKVEKKMRQLELIDAQEFKKYRRYMIFLFRKK